MDKQVAANGSVTPDEASIAWHPQTVIEMWRDRDSQFEGLGVARLLLRRYRKYVGSRVLDVGAGMRGPMRLLPGSVGLDLAPRQPRSIGGDLCLMPLRAASFDTVFSIEVLEHLPGDRLHQGLTEIGRVLQPGGHAILVTPYREPLDRRMTVCPHCGTKFHWLGHVRSFDEESMAQAIRGAGLTPVKMDLLHLAFKGQHPLLGAFSFLLAPMGLRQPKNMVTIARRPA